VCVCVCGRLASRKPLTLESSRDNVTHPDQMIMIDNSDMYYCGIAKSEILPTFRYIKAIAAESARV